jgi:hypothetical protein
MVKRLQSVGFPAALGTTECRSNSCTVSPNLERWRFGLLLVAMLALTGTWTPASANDQVGRAANASVPDVIADRSVWESGLEFESNYQRNWYKVFWTGKCEDLPFFDRLLCLKGSTPWSEVTRIVMDKARPDTRDDIRVRMIQLGRMIGHEWARHNEDRRIDNDDLLRWSDWLKKSKDVNATVDRLAKDAQKLLNSKVSRDPTDEIR